MKRLATPWLRNAQQIWRMDSNYATGWTKKTLKNIKSESVLIKMEEPSCPQERRLQTRAGNCHTKEQNSSFPAFPVYQLQVRDLSPKGNWHRRQGGFIFLKMIYIGQELDVKLFSSAKRETLTEYYKSKIEHVSELKCGRFRGHWAVGMAIIHQII